MFEPTQRRISEKIKSTLDSDALPFHEFLDADMVEYVLRCKSPEIVEKEILIYLLVYDLIRGVMDQAAGAHEKRPRQLSFKGTLQTITAFQEAMRRAAPADREFLLQAMLRAIAQQEAGDRFGRVEPRANKRRPKAQRYLMEPRPDARNACARRHNG